jgi:hypothetical protein
MGSTIHPRDGTLLPADAMIAVVFSYQPDIRDGEFLVNWHSDTYALQFAKYQTSIENGVTHNVIYYKGVTPSKPPTITVRNAETNELLISVNYDFSVVSFTDNVMSYPDGVQALFPFGGRGDPLVNGVKVLVRCIDPSSNNKPVENFPVLFSSVKNAAIYYDGAGAAIDPLPQGPDQGPTLHYPCYTDNDGVASVIAMPASAGIFILDAGIVSYGLTVQGQIVLLNQVAPAEEDLLDPLEFPGVASDTIDFDNIPGPTIPVNAPAEILDMGPARPFDRAVIATYNRSDGPGTALIAGEVVNAEHLVQGVGIAKARVPVGGPDTCFYYLISNGIASWQSSTEYKQATGTSWDGPDLSLPRLTGFAPETPDVTVINATATVGGLTVVASAVLVRIMRLAPEDRYEFNVYIDAWSGTSLLRKRDFFSRAGIQGASGGAIAQILPQEWFAGYSGNGGLPGKVQFEFVGYLAASGGQPVYSDILALAIDTRS